MVESIVMGAIIVVVLSAIVLYNRLVRNKHLVKEAWSDIDVQLIRRHSLLPNLVSAVRAYADYESETLVRLTQARADGENGKARRSAENSISHELRQLLAVAEAYPELKANGNFLDLQHNITELEEQIQYARRYYNGTVRNLNVLIESFPSNVISHLFHFDEAEYFEIELATLREAPALKL